MLLIFLLPKLLVNIRNENRKLGAEVAAAYIPVPMRFAFSNPICLKYCVCDEKGKPRHTKCCCCCCCYLCCCFWARRGFWAENQEFVKGLEAARKKPKTSEEDPKKKSFRSAVCHGEVDERVDWHETEFITETTGLQRRSHPNLYVGNAMKLGVPCGGWSFWLFQQAEDYWCLA